MTDINLFNTPEIKDSKDDTYNKLKGKIHISFSEYSKYEECSYRHLLENYLGIREQPQTIHLIFGNSIHKAIECGIKEHLNLKDRISVFKSEFNRNMTEFLSGTEEFKEVKDFTNQGINILKILEIEKISSKYDIVSVEEPLYEPIAELTDGGFYFKGFIDLILKYKGEERYLIIDWKTSTQEWILKYKLQDEIFLSQTRFYKYFYGQKFNIKPENIDCKYVVLNRLLDKKEPKKGFGKIQTVEVESNLNEINESVAKLKTAVENIHKNKEFPKAKLNNREDSCKFCPYKYDSDTCNSDTNQHKEMLKKYTPKKTTLVI